MPFRRLTLRFPAILVVVGTALGYFALGRLAFASSVTHDIVTQVVFGAEGVALAAVLRWGRSAALGVFGGQLVLALSTGLPVGPSIAVSIVNAIECLLAGWFGRKVGLDPNLSRLRDLLLLFGGALFLFQPFSAVFGTGALWAMGRIPPGSLVFSGFSWWLGNVLGQCVVAPALLVLSKPPRSWFPGPLFAAVGLVIAGILGFGLFGGPSLPTFPLALAFCLPLVMAVAVAYGLNGTALAGMGLSGVAIAVTSMGRGPFHASWIELDLFLAGSLTALALGALLDERRAMEAKLRCQNEALEQANGDLIQALTKVQTLEGLLPICAYCKHIRDDKGYWNGIEQYLAQRSQLHFTHGICPNCREKFFEDRPEGPTES